MEAKLGVAEAELKHARQLNEPVSIAEAKATVAEAKTAVVKQEAAVAEAKTAVAKHEFAVAEAKFLSAGPDQKDVPIRCLELAQKAYERSLCAG